MEIKEHTFLITGGSSGLGKSTAQALLQSQAKVAIADVDRESGEHLVSELKGDVLFITLDVRDTADIDVAFSQIEKRFGAVHGVINCAGILVAERIVKKDGNLCNQELFQQCIDINLIGTFNMIRSSSRLLIENTPNLEGERGVIINTASIAAFEGQIGQAAYAASKAGVIGMTLPLARELGQFGIRVMTIAPGLFDTPLFRDLRDDQLSRIEQQIPFPNTLGNPKDFAQLVQHIIRNPMLNGETIRLDGALRLGAKF